VKNIPKVNFVSIPILLALVILSVFISGSNSSNGTRYVSITFDDLPMNSKYYKDSESWKIFTTKLIKTIKKNKVPAIGFVNEKKLYDNEVIDPEKVEVLQQWINASLELGNHTYSHPDLHKVPLNEFLEDLKSGEEVTKKLLVESGQEMKYFRHPFLHTGRDLETKEAVESFLKKNGYSVAPVTIDNGEWIFARAYENAFSEADTAKMRQIGDEYISYMEKIFRYYEQQSIDLLGYEIKQILLLHANLLNSEYLDELVSMMKKRDYNFISLEEAITDSAYQSEDTFTGSGGITWLHRWALTAGKRGDFFKGEPEVAEFVKKASGFSSY